MPRDPRAIMLCGARARRRHPTGGAGLARDWEPGYLLVQATLLPALGAWFRWSIEGSENVPERGPAIVACNHVAYLDPLAVGYAIDKAGRRPRFLTKSELFRDRRIGWALRATRQIEVRRGTVHASSALDQALDALRTGEIVVIFPEGTVTTDPDLEPMAPKSGAIRLALRSHAPVIPCAVWGTANVWPKGHYAKRWWPGQDILVRFGEPMAVAGDPDSRRAITESGQRVMERIAALVSSLKPVLPDSRRPSRRSA
jgi:1-acyl-sn-glycerol-3-phosphate acyltransferase